MSRYSALSLSALCAATLLVFGSTAVAGNPKAAAPKKTLVPENKAEITLIANLSSDDPRKVLNALDDLAEQPHPSTNVLAVARKMLSDPRPAVRKKVVRVLGIIHAPLTPEEIKSISTLLKSYDPSQTIAVLKALCDLNAVQTVPEIVPLLHSSDAQIVRNACRSLAALGSKNLIPQIEPLVKHRDGGVRSDAREAIAALRVKN